MDPKGKGPQAMEKRVSYTLEHLLAADVLQSAIEILEPLNNIGNLSLVFTLELARRTDGNVQRQFHRRRATRKPAATAVVVQQEADLVLPGVRCRERQASFKARPLRNNLMVVVEHLIDRDLNVKACVRTVETGLRVQHLRFVVSYSHQVELE
jgi:hypothetical protein